MLTVISQYRKRKDPLLENGTREKRNNFYGCRKYRMWLFRFVLYMYVSVGVRMEYVLFVYLSLTTFT